MKLGLVGILFCFKLVTFFGAFGTCRKFYYCCVCDSKGPPCEFCLLLTSDYLEMAYAPVCVWITCELAASIGKLKDDVRKLF